MQPKPAESWCVAEHVGPDLGARMFLVCGGPGIGKTRLAEELASRGTLVNDYSSRLELEGSIQRRMAKLTPAHDFGGVGEELPGLDGFPQLAT
jgi:hypothetical protein